MKKEMILRLHELLLIMNKHNKSAELECLPTPNLQIPPYTSRHAKQFETKIRQRKSSQNVMLKVVREKTINLKQKTNILQKFSVAENSYNQRVKTINCMRL